LQATVAGLLPVQNVGLDLSEQLEAFSDEYVRTIVPPLDGRLVGARVSEAVGAGGACSVRVRDWLAVAPRTLLALKVTIHCCWEVVAGTCAR
jgi:hypothetical protein